MKKTYTNEELEERIKKGQKRYGKLVGAHLALSFVEAQAYDMVVPESRQEISTVKGYNDEDIKAMMVDKVIEYFGEQGQKISYLEAQELLSTLEKEGKLDELLEETGLNEEVKRIESEAGQTYETCEVYTRTVKPTLLGKVKGALVRPLRVICGQMLDQCKEKVDKYQETLNQQKGTNNKEQE